MRLRKVMERLNDFCPFDWQDGFDNSGLQFGSLDAECSKVLFSLDLSIEAIKEASEKKCDLIITHHPFFFKSLKQIDPTGLRGRVIKLLFDENIAVISCHTNWDKHPKGVSFALSEALSLENKKIMLKFGENYGYGYVGEISKVKLSDFISKVKTALSLPNAKLLFGNPDAEIKKIAVLGGSGGGFIDEAKNSGADLFITGDLGYHDGQRARELDISLLDIGHFHSEKFGMRYMIEFVSDFLPNPEMFFKPLYETYYF